MLPVLDPARVVALALCAHLAAKGALQHLHDFGQGKVRAASPHLQRSARAASCSRSRAIWLWCARLVKGVCVFSRQQCTTAVHHKSAGEHGAGATARRVRPPVHGAPLVGCARASRGDGANGGRAPLETHWPRAPKSWRSCKAPFAARCARSASATSRAGSKIGSSGWKRPGQPTGGASTGGSGGTISLPR